MGSRDRDNDQEVPRRREAEGDLAIPRQAVLSVSGEGVLLLRMGFCGQSSESEKPGPGGALFWWV
jgi:hypothetical protein